MRLRTRIGAGFAAAMVIVLAIAAMSWVGATDLLATTHAADRANAVLRALDDVQADLTDIEDGSRGYLLTGIPEFLEPFERGRKLLLTDLDQLAVRLGTDDTAQAALGDLRAVAHRRLDNAAALVEGRRRGEFNASAGVVESRIGKQLMDQARATLVELRQRENQSLTTQSAQARRRARIALALIFASTCGMLLLVLGATLLLTRAITKPLGELARAA
ncbi:MAG: CHASE3 domain-containing protein, partial [Polyangia bacterium]